MCAGTVSRHICRKWRMYRHHCSVWHRCNLVFRYYCRYYSREKGIYLLFLAANFKKCALALRVCWVFLKNGGSFQSAYAMNGKSGKRLDERHLGTRHGFPPPVSESALIFACLALLANEWFSFSSQKARHGVLSAREYLYYSNNIRVQKFNSHLLWRVAFLSQIRLFTPTASVAR